jgi:S1-C subfamily serine protease
MDDAPETRWPAPPPPPPPRPPGRSGIGVVGALLLIGLGMLIYRFAVPRLLGPLHDPNATSRTVLARGDLAESEKGTIALYKAASRAVVHITNVGLRSSPFSMDVRAVRQGTGSGFVWDTRGYVVTNAHVVRAGQQYRVTLADDTTYQADLVGAEPSVDVAVLKLRGAPAEKLLPLAVGSAADLEVGQSVYAIGNPFGLDQTLTTGVVSGLGREINTDAGETIRGVIQTDAAINPGNSGGPLLDSAGRLIGMNTAIISPSQASAGIGFAIPVEMVNGIVPRLIRGARESAGLGVTLGPDSALRQRGMEGALVINVLPDSAAQKAGVRGTRQDPETGEIELGDVIVAIDEKPIRGQLDLGTVLDAYQVGQAARLTVLRKAERVTLDVTLQQVVRR